MTKKWIFLISGMIIAASTVILTVTPLGTILAYRVAPDYPTNETQTLKIAGLKENVEIYFDDYGVPHIEAQNVEDLVRATGFMQGRYRFYQLDVLRRFASGRISELLGEQRVLSSSTVEIDMAMRGWGFYKLTKMDINTLPKLDQKILLAFSDGVNQSLKHYTPIEYKILGEKPKEWNYQDSLVVALLQAWSITQNWEQEAVRFSLALNLGDELADKIYPNDPFETSPTIPTTNRQFPLPTAIDEELKLMFPKKPNKVSSYNRSNVLESVMGDLMQMRPSASNAWAVSGSRSKSGSPIISNDMHLSHMLPSLLFLQHLKAPGIDAIGATMPGLPFIVSGHNKKIAWGATSSVADVVDLYVEKPHPTNPKLVQHDSRKCELTETKEIIRIKDKKRFRKKSFYLRRSCHGPILNDMYPNFFKKNAPMVAIRWELPNVSESLGHLYRAAKSDSLDELRTHLMQIPAPVTNIIAASKEGDIAFFATGSIPIRKNHRGTFPVPGWLGKYEWDGVATIDQMPSAKNPVTGFLANTNNQVIHPKAHRPLFHIDTAPSYRYERVVKRLDKIEKHTRQSIQDIQSDQILIRGKRVLPKILNDLKGFELNKEEQVALELLKSWDLSADKNSIGMTIFMTTYRESIINSLSNKLPKRALHTFLKQRYSTNTVDEWYDDEFHPVWDNLNTTQIENRKFAIYQSFKDALSYLKKYHGNDIKNWNWGKLHYHQPKHPFGKKSVLSFFNLKKIEHSGSLDSVWKAHFNFHDNKSPYKTVAGPVFRLAIDLANFEDAKFSTDTGQSGWPLSPHYGDIYEKWQQGKLIPMHSNWKKIRTDFSDKHMTLTSAE